MSFQEKSNWVMTGAMVVVYGWYFATVASLARSNPVSQIGYQGIMFATVIGLVVLAVIGHIVIAVVDPKGADQNDERDRAISRFGESWGGVVLGIAVIANTLLAGLVLAELTAMVTRLVLYRRGV